jgi:hypothetical protein
MHFTFTLFYLKSPNILSLPKRDGKAWAKPRYLHDDIHKAWPAFGKTSFSGSNALSTWTPGIFTLRAFTTSLILPLSKKEDFKSSLLHIIFFFIKG